jgi:amidase
MSLTKGFNVVETTISDIHTAYRSGALTARQLVHAYLDRIDTYDQQGPEINALISLNKEAFAEADRLDGLLEDKGLAGPLHGIPIVIKDQADVREMPTTMGSVLFDGHMPQRDCFVAAKLRSAGAIFIGKATLGEMGGGDTHGSLFGSTRNVYDLDRTAGGSSGGSAACVSANFCTVGVGQEGFASIRRPSTWNGIVGMRPTAGLVSRTGVYSGWPSVAGSLGPMARTVSDLAKLLDCMIGYDPADPLTARGVGQAPEYFVSGLSVGALEGARIGVLRDVIGNKSEPDSDDFGQITEVFDRAVGDLRRAGAQIIDPIAIPNLTALLASRAGDGDVEDEAFKEYVSGSAHPPYGSRQEMRASNLMAKVTKTTYDRVHRSSSLADHRTYLKARDLLMTQVLKVMADHRLGAIVHKAVEHKPTLIKEFGTPDYVDMKGAPFINTFLVYVPALVVPAGFTWDKLPAGITFLGRPYDDARVISFAYAYEQATHHRQAPPILP